MTLTVAVLTALYGAAGVLVGTCVYVGTSAAFPRLHDGPWEFDGDLLILAVIAAIIWPVIALADPDAETGWRYLTTDWDPWEERGSSFSHQQLQKMWQKAMGTSYAGSAPNGYNAEPIDVVEGSEPLIGHRVWRLFEDDRGPVLGSTIARHLYHGPIARTDREELEAGRGLFAAKPDHPFYEGEKPRLVVEGTVELFGRVVEGEKGYRAEKLRITSLTLRPGGWHEPTGKVPEGAERQFCACETAERPWPYPYTDLVDALAERYRCEVEYAPREGTNAFEGPCVHGIHFRGFTPVCARCASPIRPGGHTCTKKDGEGWDSDRLLKPEAGILERPDPEDIYRYARGA